MSAPKKVIFLHPDLGIGGAERLVLDVASALKDQNKDIMFLTNHFDKNHAFEELKRGDFPVEVYGDWLPRNIFGKCHALCAYVRMIYLTFAYCLWYKKVEKIDVFFVDLIPVAIPILKLFNEKVIYYCHHPDLLASNPGGNLKKLYRKPIDWLEVKSTKQADILLVNSEYTARIFRHTFPEITKPIQVVYPTVAESFIQLTEKITESKKMHEIIPDIQPNSYTFLSINRYHPAKKLDLAINAMDVLHQNVALSLWKKIFLVIAGGYDPQSSINAKYFDELSSLVSQKNLREKIVFVKSPSDVDKTLLLLACDCLIYTPVKEHFGIVPLEAMTVSKPVIACNSGGPRETVDHGNNGYLCEPTPESLAQFMEEIIRNDGEKLGEKGSIILEEKFSHKKFTAKINHIVNNI